MKSLRTEILQLFVDNSLNIPLLSPKRAMTDFDTWRKYLNAILADMYFKSQELKW